MKIELNLYATLSRYLPDGLSGEEKEYDVNRGATVDDLLQLLKIPVGQVKLVFLNGVHANRDTVLSEGCRVGIFPPVGGG
ncbi:MAG: MoaD/ThiS family protein [Desulfobacteraceae bacterium]|nr:MoaD/ThiS family protein [Desulfobacteraceae bacterium]